MNIGICLRTMSIWVDEFVKACEDLKFSHRLIDIDRADWRKQLDSIDLFIWRIHLSDLGGLHQARMKLPMIEAMGIYCFPSSQVTQLYDNKILQSYLFDMNRIPTPATFVSFHEGEARDFVRTASYPLVAKTSNGASSTGVRLLRSATEGHAFVRQAFRSGLLPPLVCRIVRKVGTILRRPDLSRYGQVITTLKYVYLQEYIPSEGDVRITTFGEDTVSAFRRLNRPKDFRASGSGRWERLTPETLPADACDLAMRVSREQGFPVMTYDFLQREKEWLISEISYGFLFNRIYTDTLFRKKNGEFRKIDPVPLGHLHLHACLEKMGKR